MRRTAYLLVIGILLHLVLPSVAWSDNSGIQVETEQPGAKVFLDGNYVGETKAGVAGLIYLRVAAEPGKHTIRCEFTNYNPIEEQLIVPENDYLRHKIVFVASKIETQSLESTTTQQVIKTGTIKIRSNPSGAYVDFDKQTISNTTPCSISKVPVGAHEIRVYFDIKTSLSIKISLAENDKGEVPVLTIDADFDKNTIVSDAKYLINIRSDPLGTLYVDGKLVGELPQATNLLNGTHSIEIRKDGYRTLSASYEAQHNDYLRYNLTKIIYSLNISSNPTGCNIAIDGKQVGKTPMNVVLDWGQHMIVLTKEGYDDNKTQYDVKVESGALSITLIQQIAQMDIEFDSAANLREDVYIGNSYIGSTPIKSVRISSGTNTIKIGKHIWTFTFLKNHKYVIHPSSLLQKISVVTSANALTGYKNLPQKPSLNPIKSVISLPGYLEEPVEPEYLPEYIVSNKRDIIKGWGDSAWTVFPSALLGAYIGAGLSGSLFVDPIDPGKIVLGVGVGAGLGTLTWSIIGWLFAIEEEVRTPNAENIEKNKNAQNDWISRVLEIKSRNNDLLEAANKKLTLEYNDLMKKWNAEVVPIIAYNNSLLNDANAKINIQNMQIDTINKTRGSLNIEDLGIVK